MNHRLGTAALAGMLFCSPALAADADAQQALDDALSAYREACVAPYYGAREPQAIVVELAKNPERMERLLESLANGAPQNWRSLADRALPLTQRLEAALDLLGMAISHGTPGERLVAEAYSVELLPVPEGTGCKRPAGVDAFLSTANFWGAAGRAGDSAP